ncbi:MAG: acetate--CoA ligase family protein [Anaerolineales bacterium]|nr:acetate--CoA ligase family protein [Anaerolineales bacterium]
MTIQTFFNPKGVVIIGASTSPEKLGYGAARNLVNSGYTGAIHFVSQKSGELFGHPLYTDLSLVPDPLDLAVLIVPAKAMPEILQACVKRGVKTAIVVTAGFREAGPEGAVLEQQCLEFARANDLRFIGPNCIGILDTHLPLDTTFIPPPMPDAGGIGFISHSGAFCAAIIDWARTQGFGFSRLASLGNQADVNETDMLPVLAADEHTRVIVLYLESVSNGREFVRVASEVSKLKPVIALKVGRFESGQKAAASHTGALAGSEAAFEAAFAKAGVFRADTTEQVFDWARALESCPLPRGRDMAILTDAGGLGVIAADSLETNGLHLAQLSDSTLKALSAKLPPAAAIHNPVDMLASASPDDFTYCLKLLLNDDNVHGVMVILPAPPMFTAESVAEAMIPVIQKSDKPVVIALTGSKLVNEARKLFDAAKIITYPFPERAASALSILARRTEALDQGPQTKDHQESSTVHSQRPTVKASLEEMMTAYGIPTAPIKLACNANEAASVAKELGFPVVLKIASPDILHKSDVGGVLLNLSDPSSVRSGYTQMVEHIKSAMPEARIEGVHIQRQIPQGQEVIVGAVRDALFGPLMMFGSGGVEVEGLKDVAFGLAPLNQVEAREMIRKTWAGRKLKGFRNIPPADEDAVVDVLVKLSQLAMEHEDIQEIEINPLRVLSKEAAAVDVRIKF